MNTNNEILFSITKDEVLLEFEYHTGRKMSVNEYERIKKLLEFGIGEAMVFVYSGVFSEFRDKVD